MTLVTVPLAIYFTVAQILCGDFHKADLDSVTPVHQIVTGCATNFLSFAQFAKRKV